MRDLHFSVLTKISRFLKIYIFPLSAKPPQTTDLGQSTPKNTPKQRNCVENVYRVFNIGFCVAWLFNTYQHSVCRFCGKVFFYKSPLYPTKGSGNPSPRQRHFGGKNPTQKRQEKSTENHFESGKKSATKSRLKTVKSRRRKSRRKSVKGSNEKQSEKGKKE